MQKLISDGGGIRTWGTSVTVQGSPHVTVLTVADPRKQLPNLRSHVMGVRSTEGSSAKFRNEPPTEVVLPKGSLRSTERSLLKAKKPEPTVVTLLKGRSSARRALP
eukprot:TRINITY_DN1163_c0_g1_i4.p1 TRINITY_DN1163_c0_g1~~TRINITY_DN1163_c0_g1_i4.p1  ORF type:complete len:106 (-),score=7.95 TRINITY_DN1163_c0_g1_i4:270-587(-)